MNTQTQQEQNQDQGLDLNDDTPLAPACPMNPEDREGCESCQ